MTHTTTTAAAETSATSSKEEAELAEFKAWQSKKQSKQQKKQQKKQQREQAKKDYDRIWGIVKQRTQQNILKNHIKCIKKEQVFQLAKDEGNYSRQAYSPGEEQDVKFGPAETKQRDIYLLEMICDPLWDGRHRNKFDYDSDDNDSSDDDDENEDGEFEQSIGAHVTSALCELEAEGVINSAEAQYVDEKQYEDSSLEDVFPELAKKIDGVVCAKNSEDPKSAKLVFMSTSKQKKAGVVRVKPNFYAVEAVDESRAKQLLLMPS